MHVPLVLLTALLAAPLRAHPTTGTSSSSPPNIANELTLLQDPNNHHQHNPSPSLLSHTQAHSGRHPPRQTRTPTRHESTLLARRLLALSSWGYLSTSFPTSDEMASDPAYKFTPGDVAGGVLAGPEYFADCGKIGEEGGEDGGGGGEPVMIRLRISNSGKNSREGRNVSLGVDWWERYRELGQQQGLRGGDDVGAQGWIEDSPAALPRMSLMGCLEVLSEQEVAEQGLVECFEGRHPDAKHWRPGDDRGAHTGEWVRLKVREVYWVGGFGGRAWIGWLDVKGGDWAGIGRKGWERARLPGEEGWWRMPWFEGGEELGGERAEVGYVDEL